MEYNVCMVVAFNIHHGSFHASEEIYSAGLFSPSRPPASVSFFTWHRCLAGLRDGSAEYSESLASASAAMRASAEGTESMEGGPCLKACAESVPGPQKYEQIMARSLQQEHIPGEVWCTYSTQKRDI